MILVEQRDDVVTGKTSQQKHDDDDDPIERVFHQVPIKHCHHLSTEYSDSLP